MANVLSIEVEDELNAGLSKLAEHTGRTVEELHWIALKMFVDEELQHVDAVLEGIADCEAGRFVTQEEMEARVDALRAQLTHAAHQEHGETPSAVG